MIDIATGGHQAHAPSLKRVLLLQSSGQPRRPRTLDDVVRVGKVKPHGQADFFLAHAYYVIDVLAGLLIAALSIAWANFFTRNPAKDHAANASESRPGVA